MDPVEQDLLYKQQSANMLIEINLTKRPSSDSAQYDAWKDEQNRLQRNFEIADKRLADYQEEKRKNDAKGASGVDTAVVNGKLVNKATGEVIGDYSDAPGPRKTQAQIDAESAADVAGREASRVAALASAGSSSASAALTESRRRTEEATREATIAEGTAKAQAAQTKLASELMKLREAELLVQRTEAALARVTAATQLDPNDPAKMQELTAATLDFQALQDPAGALKEIREQAKWEVDQGLQRARDERENRRLALEEQRFKADTDKEAKSAERLLAQEQRQEREGVATGVRDLLKLENERAQTAAQTRAQHMKSGLGSLRDSPEFQRMQQNIDPTMAAQAVGMDPNSLKFQAIWNAWNQRGQGGQGAPPELPTQTQGPTGPQTAQDLASLGKPGMAQNWQGGMKVGDPYDIQEPGGNIQAEFLRPAIMQTLQPPPPTAEEENPLDAIQNRTPIAALLESVHQAV